MTETPNSWEKFVPWFLTIISATIMIGIGWFIVDNILWLRNDMFDDATTSNLSYRSHQYFLLVSTVRRSAGLFAGITLILLGVGVVFYVAKSQTTMDVSGSGFKLGLVTASPGIIAMTLGTFLIAHNTSSKDSIPIFASASPAVEHEVSGSVDQLDEAFIDIFGGSVPAIDDDQGGSSQ